MRNYIRIGASHKLVNRGYIFFSSYLSIIKPQRETSIQVKNHILFVQNLFTSNYKLPLYINNNIKGKLHFKPYNLVGVTN